MRITAWFRSLWNVTVVDYNPTQEGASARLIITPFALWLEFGILGNYFLDLFFTGEDFVHAQIRQKPLSYNRPFTISTRTGSRYNPNNVIGVIRYTDGELLGYVAPAYRLTATPIGTATYAMYPYTHLEQGKSYVFIQGKQMATAVRHSAGLMGPATCISDFTKRVIGNTVMLNISVDNMINDDYYSSNVITVTCGDKTVDMYVMFNKDIVFECYDDSIITA
jgi:hypothetical protein